MSAAGDKVNLWTVAIILADRACMGPIDDGNDAANVWYDCFTLVDDEAWAIQLLRAFTTEDAAVEYADSLTDILALKNEGRPPISSVLSEGRYVAYVFEGLPVKYSPVPEV